MNGQHARVHANTLHAPSGRSKLTMEEKDKKSFIWVRKLIEDSLQVLWPGLIQSKRRRRLCIHYLKRQRSRDRKGTPGFLGGDAVGFAMQTNVNSHDPTDEWHWSGDLLCSWTGSLRRRIFVSFLSHPNFVLFSSRAEWQQNPPLNRQLWWPPKVIRLNWTVRARVFVLSGFFCITSMENQTDVSTLFGIRENSS